MKDGRKILAAQPQRPFAISPYHTWEISDGEPWLEFFKIDGCIVLRFPGLADFHVTERGDFKACVPVPGLDEDTRVHLYKNQVVPLLLNAQGRMAFHGSATAMGSGAVAFLGASGLGKSTLATAFAKLGYPFLTDDLLHVEPSKAGRYQVRPSEPSIRMWDASRNEFFDNERAVSPRLSYTSKARLPAGADLQHCAEPRDLTAAYFLLNESPRTVEIGEVRGMRAHLSWVESSFLLDPGSKDALKTNFDHIAGLVRSVPCYSLDYTRKFSELDSVMDAVREHSSKQAQAI